MWGCMIHSYVIGRGNTATAYLQAGMIRPVPDATADAVVDVQVQRTGGESRLKDEEVVLFFLAEKRAERTCGEEKMATPGWTEKKRSSAPMRRGSVPQKIYWEGINLNKISKKIVSAVTMGAFALTLIPAAAFGATIGTDQATVELNGGNQTVILDSTGEASVTVEATIQDGWTGLTNPQLGLWVGDEDGASDKNVNAGTAVYSFADVSGDDGDTGIEGDYSTGPVDGVWNNSWWSQDTLSADNTYKIQATFTAPGVYDLWTGIFVNGTTDFTTVQPHYVGTVTVEATDAVADNSRLLIDGKVGPASATQNEPKEVTFDIWNDTTQTTQPLADTVYVWVENSKGEIVRDADFSGTTPVSSKKGVFTVNGLVDSKTVLDVTFPDAGDGYTINAAVAEPTIGADNKVTVDPDAEIAPITVNVAPAEVETAYFSFTNVTNQEAAPEDNNYDTNWSVRIRDEVTPSDTKVYTVTGYAWIKNNVPAEGEKIYVSADKGMNLQGLAEDGTVTTDNTGKFTFKFTLEDAGQYDVTLREVNNDASATLTVTQGDVDAASIAKVSDGGYVLAGNDYDYASQVYGNGPAYFSDAVQFAITDVYGRDAVGAGVLADEAAANVTNSDHDGAVRIIDKGENSTLTAKDLVLAWDEEAGVYTLAYVDADKDGAAKDLTPGEYSVRVALNNGGRNAVTVNFTVAEFGEVQELVLDTTAHAGQSWEANDNAITAIDNQVALGQWVNVVPKYVDANGLKVKADISDLQVGVNGDAVVDRHITKDTIAFRVANNTAANNAYVGSTITVRVNDPSLGAIGYVVKELTVVKNYQAETVSIDPTQGVVGEPNTVNVTVVAGEEISKVNGKLSATIVGQSDETADVNVRVNPDVKNGKASLYLESDKAGTADVRVVVTADNGELYADTFTYTFGDEDPYAGSYIVMTIGSDQYLINNEVLDGSKDNLGAPYVDDAWRTMVPVRVLAESFGADVDFDEEAQTVTVVDGDTTIVMTVGSTEYTINGEPAEAMNTAPVIGSDNRTYVPVRFVAEGLGYEVTPMYDAENGTTASVVFMK